MSDPIHRSSPPPFEGILLGFEDASDTDMAKADSTLLQVLTQLPEVTSQPLPSTHGVSCGCSFEQLLQELQDLRSFFQWVNAHLRESESVLPHDWLILHPILVVPVGWYSHAFQSLTTSALFLHALVFWPPGQRTSDAVAHPIGFSRDSFENAILSPDALRTPDKLDIGIDALIVRTQFW